MTVTIIGVDCAAQARNTGLARAMQRGEQLVVEDARSASSKTSAASIVAKWVQSSERVLLALDAPLGWPVAFGRELADHRAGEPFHATAREMFRRLTDYEIHKRLHQLPLAVAADRIAWAAHAALRFLEELRELIGTPAPLVWTPDWQGRFGVIEVYPAATRKALVVPTGKGSVAGLESRVVFQPDVAASTEHERDAVVCAVAGLEFLAGRVVPPSGEQMALASLEGWIWAGPSPLAADNDLAEAHSL